MQTDAEPAAPRLRRNAKAGVLVTLLVAGLGALVVAAGRDEEPFLSTYDCPPPTPIYLTATIAPGRPTPGPGTPWPTVVGYALCA